MSTTATPREQTLQQQLVDTPAVEAAAPVPARRERLLSLDVFRGMTVAGMLLVNDPGTWGAIYPPLAHAEWHGWTPTDLIFPFFLFIVGITTHLSTAVRRAKGDTDAELVRQIVRRGALIFLIGFLMSAFPFFQWGPAPEGVASWTFLDRVAYRWDNVRIMGVLQRIGLAFLLCGLLTLRTTVRQQIAIVAALLFGYWLAMTLIPVGPYALGLHALGDEAWNLSAVIDRAILTPKHMWSGGGGKFEPEGLLSTLPAVGTAMLGALAGRWIGAPRPLVERVAGLFFAGAIGAMLGQMWHWSFPINKSLWTSSYVLFTAGVACTVLAACMWVIDLHRIRGWTKPFEIYGVNPMVAFVGSGVMARLIYSIFKVGYEGREISLQSAIYRSLFASWIPTPETASLAFAVAFVLFWLAILWVLYRKRIFLKV